MNKPIDSGIAYAVKITRKDGTSFLAHGINDFGANLFWTWKKASAYKRELAKHCRNCRVVKVEYEIRLLTRKAGGQ